MASIPLAPEPASVAPRLRLRARRTQQTKSLLPLFSPLPPVLRDKNRHKCATPISRDEHEMRIKRTLKTIRAFDSAKDSANMLCTDGNLAAPSRTNRKHQDTRHNKTADQVPQPGGEIVSAANQITHHHCSNKTAEISD